MVGCGSTTTLAPRRRPNTRFSTTVGQRCEKERVEREPQADPHQDPAPRVEDQVGVAGGADDARLHDDEKEPQDDDRDPDPQREDAVEPDGSPLPFVVGDPVVAVASERPADALVQAVLDRIRRQGELDPHGATARAVCASTNMSSGLVSDSEITCGARSAMAPCSSRPRWAAPGEPRSKAAPRAFECNGGRANGSAPRTDRRQRKDSDNALRHRVPRHAEPPKTDVSCLRRPTPVPRPSPRCRAAPPWA